MYGPPSINPTSGYRYQVSNVPMDMTMVMLLRPRDLNRLQIEPGSSNGAKSEI